MLEKIVLEYVLPILAPVVTGFLIYLMNLAVQKINLSIKNEKLRQSMNLIEDATEKVVTEVMQTVVDAQKAKKKNGKLNVEDAVEAKQLAMDKIKEMVGPESLATVGKIMKLNTDQLSNLIGSNIEAAVYRSKAR